MYAASPSIDSHPSHPQYVPSRLAEFVEWDTQNWSAALAFWRRHSTLDLAGCSALEIGSRHGGLTLWLALQGAHVVCSDVRGASERAIQKHAAAGVADRIRYECIDARCIPYVEHFDLVVFKSVLGAVSGPDRRVAQAGAIAEMHRALKRGGELFFAENLIGSPAHRFFRSRFVPWGSSWRYVSIREMLGFLAPFAEVRYAALGFAGAFGRTHDQRDALGRLDQAVFERLVPPRWRYIMTGVARK